VALRLVRVWLETPFEGGRHATRVQKIRDIEDRNFK
jgi:ribose 5-phosphate isomerase RpiB